MSSFFIFIICSCIDPPKDLPPSRIIRASTGSMIQFGELRAFLVTRGEERELFLWTVEQLNDQSKQCALEQIPSDSKGLVIEHNSNSLLAQTYLKVTTAPISLVCPQ